MNRPNREINIISMSALDLFASALGVFLLLSVISLQAKTPVDDMDICFVVDFTGSMKGAIGQLRDNLAGVVRVLQKLSPRLSVGVVAYRDRADEIYVTREFPLTLMETAADVERLEQWLDEVVQLQFGTNPDREEAVEAGLRAATALPWPEAARRPQVIVLVGDAAGYPEERESTLALVRSFAAGGDRRKVAAIWCKPVDDPQAEFFRDLAAAGGGEFRVADRMLETVLVTVIEKEEE
jgi:hypothetical protein